jgi:hypothetical protein
MVTTDIDFGSVSLTADFQSILETTERAARWFEGWIYFDELLDVDGDIVEVKVWTWNKIKAQWALYTRQIIQGTQEDAAKYIGGVFTRRIKVEVAQTDTSPVFKELTYEFTEVT